MMKNIIINIMIFLKYFHSLFDAYGDKDIVHTHKSTNTDICMYTRAHTHTPTSAHTHTHAHSLYSKLVLKEVVDFASIF